MPSRPPGLIWLASYPKSGNTWMRILLSNLFAGTEQAENINALSLQDGIVGDRSAFEDLTLVDSHLLTAEEVEALRPATHDASAAAAEGAIVKVHDAYSRLADGTPLLGRAARGVLYVVRDPRDVAVSFAFHQSRSMEWAVDFLNTPTAFLRATEKQFRQHLGDWSSHVLGWLDQTDVPLHLIRYEDLHSNTMEVFCRALDFLGVSVRQGEVEKAVRHSDFSELKRQERSMGFRERVQGQEAFFREGKTGGWHRHLSKDLIRRIETDHAAVMARLGYERTTQERPE